MCGISGAQCENAGLAAAKISSAQIHRGKDSAGVAWPAEYDGVKEVRIFKRLGSPSKFLRDNGEKLEALKITSAIGHNRWPSHGSICKENAHPFKSCDGSFALVHNGSATVPKGIWTFLERRGHKLQGDTDSEMFMHSIEELLKANGNDRLLALRAFNKIGSSFSVLLLFKDGEIWGTKDTWPCVIVQREQGRGTLVASEESSFRDVVPEGEKVKVMFPGIHTIYKIEKDGGITFWGEYQKEERPLKRASFALDYWPNVDFDGKPWKSTGGWPVVYSPAKPKKAPAQVPDMDRLEEAARLLPGERFDLHSKKARKRLRKMIKNNIWLQEELDDEEEFED